jgi:nitrate reductase (cytochrome), electron transfer subunit
VRASASARGLHVTLVVLAAATAAGFFSGVRSSEREGAGLLARPRGAAISAPSARSYRDMREREISPNAGVYVGAMARLEAGRPGVLDPVNQTDGERAQALERRASRRAFDGAPPTVPHRVLQMEAPSCLACHERGLVVGAARAPAMSHRRLDSCTQCHVVGADPRPVASTPLPPDNTFEGLRSWGRGARAWPGAPPTIPHPTLMRGTCAACHGTAGLSGLRSTHPWRESCPQCHASSASLDQRSPAPLGSTVSP